MKNLLLFTLLSIVVLQISASALRNFFQKSGRNKNIASCFNPTVPKDNGGSGTSSIPSFTTESFLPSPAFPANGDGFNDEFDNYQEDYGEEINDKTSNKLMRKQKHKKRVRQNAKRNQDNKKRLEKKTNNKKQRNRNNKQENTERF